MAVPQFIFGGSEMTNIYDDPSFFDKYSEMQRSTDGLDGAGEWHALKALLPSFKDKTVLDFGAGYGWHALYAAEHGAAHVFAVDQSRKMIETAKKKNPHPNIEYQTGGTSILDETDIHFDIVLSSLVFHYIEDIDALFKTIYSKMTNGGSFIFTVEHPVFTAEGSQNWVYNDNGEISHFPVDHYFYEGERTAEFLGVNVTKYHRTLETYVKALLNNGFHIKDMVEPKPADHLMNIDGMKDELRRPMMLIISAEK